MNKFYEATDVDTIEHFMRRARVERSLAFQAMGRLALDSVKNIFTKEDAGDSVCCAQH